MTALLVASRLAPLHDTHDANAHAAPSDDDIRALLRSHLECALALLDKGDLAGARAEAAHAASAVHPAEDIVVTRDGRVCTQGARAIALDRRGKLRRVLLALVARRLTAPGEALSRDEVLDVGWPGERMRPDSAAYRVYTTIKRLRQAGLGDALVTTDSGYLIDPRVSVRIRD